MDEVAGGVEGPAAAVVVVAGTAPAEAVEDWGAWGAGVTLTWAWDCCVEGGVYDFERGEGPGSASDDCARYGLPEGRARPCCG